MRIPRIYTEPKNTRAITTGLALALITTACVNGFTSPAEATQTAYQEDIDCLYGVLPADECGQRVDYSYFKSRYDGIANLIEQNTSISPRSREAIQTILQTITDMDQQGKIRWYEFDQTGPVGLSVTGRSRLTFLPGSSDFFAKVMLPKDELSSRADVLDITVHESLHAVSAYDRFLQGADPANDPTPPQEEYDAEFYGLLTGMLERLQQESPYDAQEMKEYSGIDMMSVVYHLDQKSIGPNSTIYRYLSDLSFRYRVVRQNQVIESGTFLTEEEKETIARNQSLISSIDDAWVDFPKSATAEELQIIRDIIANGWNGLGYFQFTPESRERNQIISIIQPIQKIRPNTRNSRNVGNVGVVYRNGSKGFHNSPYRGSIY